MLGDRTNLEEDRKIIEALERNNYEILTKWVVSKKLDIDKGLSPKDIFKRDINTIDTSDVLIADISYPSLGVGFEIAYALFRNKPVIAFCKKDRFNKTSALIRGISWNNFTIVVYNNINTLIIEIKKRLET